MFDIYIVRRVDEKGVASVKGSQIVKIAVDSLCVNVNEMA